MKDVLDLSLGCKNVGESREGLDVGEGGRAGGGWRKEEGVELDEQKDEEQRDASSQLAFSFSSSPSTKDLEGK